MPSIGKWWATLAALLIHRLNQNVFIICAGGITLLEVIMYASSSPANICTSKRESRITPFQVKALKCDSRLARSQISRSPRSSDSPSPRPLPHSMFSVQPAAVHTMNEHRTQLLFIAHGKQSPNGEAATAHFHHANLKYLYFHRADRALLSPAALLYGFYMHCMPRTAHCGAAHT